MDIVGEGIINKVIGNNIYLKPILYSDAEDIVRWRNSENVRKYFIYQKDFTVEGQHDWIENRVNTGQVFQFIIVERENDRSIGSVFIRDIDLIHKKGEYGIFIGEDDARGRGYGTEAARLILEYAFNVVGLHRIYLRVFSDNTAAIESYKKVGFQMEGIFRDDVYVRGKFQDITWMAVINPNDKEN